MLGNLAEPALLGFSSGLVCLAACGPVLLPWLAAAGEGGRGTARLLAQFLGGRLVGYLGFASLAWAIGLALPLPARTNAFAYGLVHIALAIALLVFAVPARRRPEPCARLSIFRRATTRSGFLAPVLLGFLTGLNLCPPFVAAGVRAAERHSLPGALAFFLLFFAGTLVWFLPYLGSALLRRLPAVPTVARYTAALVAVYYLLLGGLTLGGAWLHG